MIVSRYRCLPPADVQKIALAADDMIVILAAADSGEMLERELAERTHRAGHSWEASLYAIPRLESLGKLTLQQLPKDSPLARPGPAGDHLVRRSDGSAVVAEAYNKRFVCPPCPKCGSKAHVTSKRESIRYFQCTSKSCDHRWQALIRE
jgi:hypothetical protein